MAGREQDDALLARVAAGDREAFEALVAAYWPVAQRAAYAVLRDPDLAQDAAQECFADLYVHRARYRPDFALPAYVAAIARHKSLDILRRQGKWAELQAHMETADLRTPESEYIDRLYRHTLLGAVERLPQRSQTILKAFALEDKSYQTIAEELSMTVGQVKIALHRARKALRRVKEDWNR